MNPETHRPAAGSSPTRTSLKTAAAILLVLGMTGTALATDQPPQEPEQQRAWLVGHLVTDMQTTGSFRSDEVAQTVNLVNALSDDQVVLLARFYHVTRAKAEEDARLYAMQQSDTEEILAEAESTALLARLRRQIRRAYRQLATTSLGCQTLCEVACASIPGWCECHDYAIPEWYYGDGCYFGPVLSARYAGAYSVPVYKAFYDRSSRYNYWNNRAYVRDNSMRITNGAHGGSSSYAAANKHPHPKTPHGTAPKVMHGNPAAPAKHPKASHIAPPSTKHGGSSPAAGHGNATSKPSPHSQPHGQHSKPAGHVQHAVPGQERHEPGHARHK